MKYFDVVRMEGVDAGWLGYKKIFAPGDIKIVGTHSKPEGQQCIMEGQSKDMFKRIRDGSIIGLSVSDLFLDKKLIEMAKHEQKIIVFRSTILTNADKNERIRAINRMKGILAYCVHSGAKTAIATFAEREEDLLSSLQQLEIAMLIGADEERAKAMLSSLGDAI